MGGLWSKFEPIRTASGPSSRRWRLDEAASPRRRRHGHTRVLRRRRGASEARRDTLTRTQVTASEQSVVIAREKGKADAALEEAIPALEMATGELADNIRNLSLLPPAVLRAAIAARLYRVWDL